MCHFSVCILRCCKAHDKCYETSKNTPGCTGVADLPYILDYDFTCSNRQVSCSGEMGTEIILRHTHLDIKCIPTSVTSKLFFAEIQRPRLKMLTLVKTVNTAQHILILILLWKYFNMPLHQQITLLAITECRNSFFIYMVGWKYSTDSIQWIADCSFTVNITVQTNTLLVHWSTFPLAFRACNQAICIMR